MALAGGCGGTSAEVGQSGTTGGDAAISGGTDGGGAAGSETAEDGTGGVECVAGTERCPCYEDGTCNEALVCVSDRCVDLGGGGLPGAAGSGGGDASCSNVTPCGGDLVGTWTVTSSCLDVSGEVDLSNFGLGCASAPVTGSLRVSGSWTANADGTYSDNTTTMGVETLELPPSCLGTGGTIVLCPRIAAPLTSLGYAAVTCADSATNAGCACPATIYQPGGLGLAPMYPSASGQYTTAGSTLTITAGEQEYSYCVRGDTLTMTPQSAPTTGTLTGTVVLQRE